MTDDPITFSEWHDVAIGQRVHEPTPAGDVYGSPIDCAELRDTILVQCDDEGQVRSCSKHISALFLDCHLLTPMLRNQRSDEFYLNNGGAIVLS